MNKKINVILNTIFPNKRTNIFILAIILLGIISGSIFLYFINANDQEIVINQIKDFILNIDKNTIDYGLAFKNSLFINYLYIILIWIFGLSLIGIIINIFISYIKGFVLGFSIAAIIKTYGLKGIIFNIIYLIPCQLINIFTILFVVSYSLIFTKYLYNQIIGKSNSKILFKTYIFILLISLGIMLITALLETFLIPAILKLVVNLYI